MGRGSKSCRKGKKVEEEVHQSPATTGSEIPIDGLATTCITPDLDPEVLLSLESWFAKKSKILTAQMDAYTGSFQGMIDSLGQLLKSLEVVVTRDAKGREPVEKVGYTDTHFDKNSRSSNATLPNYSLLNNLNLKSVLHAATAPALATTLQHGADILKSVAFEKYDGTKDYNLIHDWLYTFEAYWRIFSMSETDKVNFAILHLKGSAAMFWQKYEYRAQQGKEKLVLTWEDFRDLIMQSFLPHNYVDQIRTEWRLLRQNNNSVRQYVEQFESCLLKIPDFVNEAEQVHHFLFGLNKDIRQDVKATKPTTLADAIFQAEVVEEKVRTKKIAMHSYVNGMKGGERPPQNKNRQNEVSTPEIVRQLGASKPNRKLQEFQHFKRLTDKEKVEYRKLGMCYGCKETGHTTFNCPNKIETQRNTPEGEKTKEKKVITLPAFKKAEGEDCTTEKQMIEGFSDQDLLNMRYGVVMVKRS